MVGMEGKDHNREEARATLLLMRHYAQIYTYLLACVGSHADAEDLVQEVSLIVNKKIDELDEDANFLPWARRIALSLIHI